MRRKVACLVVVAVAAATVWLGYGHFRSTRYILEHSDTFTLYSIVPNADRYLAGASPYSTNEIFHNCPVLGKVEIADRMLRLRLTEALYQGIHEAGGSASCFEPRHAIRATRGGAVVDIEICFECQAVQFLGSGGNDYVPVSRRPAGIFDETLRAGGVPLGVRKHDSQ